jgi:hypothetical protein
MTNSLTGPPPSISGTLEPVTDLLKVLEAAGVTYADLRRAANTPSVYHRVARDLVTPRIGSADVASVVSPVYIKDFLKFVFGSNTYDSSDSVRRLRTQVALRHLLAPVTHELSRDIVIYLFGLNNHVPQSVTQVGRLYGIPAEEVEALRNAARRTIRLGYIDAI